MASTDPARTPLDAPALAAMTDAIAHRGPDEDGHHREPGVALGMRRLSVIDVAGSHQPVRSEDGAVLAVFNGEIYNFEQLRRELRARGHRLATEGDSETIVHLYEEYGPQFVDRLRGMFAIALWDRARRRLVLVRDRMGVKPLYYAITAEGLAFGSEVKALIAGGLVVPELDPVAAELFLAHGFVPGPRTLFAGVRKLPPASMLVWEDGRAGDVRTYWTATDDRETGAGGSWQEDQDRLLDLLRTAVHDRMVSDVPLGVMLSGGLDSSLITALMAERSTLPVKTFSIAFAEDKGSNELADAREVASRLGTEHHELTTSAVDHPALLDRALWHQEEPVADVSGLGFLLLSELARETVTVSLSGQGADELLGGYRKHEIAALATAAQRALPRPVRRACSAAARRSSSHGAVARGVLAVTTDDPVERLLAMSRIVQPPDRLELLHPAFRQTPEAAEAAIAEVVRAQLPDGGGGSPLAQTLHLDSRLALVDNMLLYFDKLSMATSLEVRVPFMDHDVVSFCTALPDSHRVWRLRRKELLRRASRGLVADAIIDKPKRGFFHSALGAWLEANRETFVTQTLLDGRSRARSQYNEPAVRELMSRAVLDDKKAAQRLFCLVLLERWQRVFVDGDVVEALPRPQAGRASGTAAPRQAA